MEKYEKWKEAFDGKVLHVNVGKTIDMQILDGRRRVTAKFDLCGVCGEWIGCSSIKCLQCKKWVHRRWADVSHKVSLTVARDAFVYSSCLGLAAAEVEVPVFKYDSYHLEVVVRFYYLGDMLNSYGSVAEAVGARIGSAWIKLWELTGLLTDKLGQHWSKGGRFADAVYGQFSYNCSETWELYVANEVRLSGVKCCMTRMICGTGRTV